MNTHDAHRAGVALLTAMLNGDDAAADVITGGLGDHDLARVEWIALCTVTTIARQNPALTADVLERIQDVALFGELPGQVARFALGDDLDDDPGGTSCTCETDPDADCWAHVPDPRDDQHDDDS